MNAESIEACQIGGRGRHEVHAFRIAVGTQQKTLQGERAISSEKLYHPLLRPWCIECHPGIQASVAFIILVRAGYVPPDVAGVEEKEVECESVQELPSQGGFHFLPAE